MIDFDSQAWLDRWVSAGGGWHIRNGVPTLCAIQGAKIADLMPELHAPGRTDAVLAAVLDRHAVKEVWQPAE